MRSSGQTSEAPLNTTLPLAPELILLVFSHLGPRHLAVLLAVSKDTNTFASDNQLWFQFFSVKQARLVSLYGANPAEPFDKDLNYKNSCLQQIKFEQHEKLLEKQQYHQKLADLLFNHVTVYPQASKHLIQRHDFALLYDRLAKTTEPALLVRELPIALIGAMVFEKKVMETSHTFMRSGFFTQLNANLRATCENKTLSITEELEFLTAFAELAVKIPDSMLSYMKTWQNNADLCADINEVKDQVKEEQRQYCTMLY